VVAIGWAVLLTSTVALLAGCASMPTSGAVREAGAGTAAEQRGSGSQVRVFANPPQPGMSELQIVNGFLNAMNSVEPDFATAREYLAAPDEWNPYERVQVYDENRRNVGPDQNDTGYQLDTDLVGEVGADGAYQPAEPGASLIQRFSLTKVANQWRIAVPPTGVLVANIDFTREYVSTDGPINVYFFDPAYRVLVPDPIYLPKRADLLTAVADAVLRGPTSRLARAVVSAVPSGTKLASRPVTVVNGQITVGLDRSAARLDDAQRKLLTAQLVWSLSGVSDGASVLVTADGVPLYPRATTTTDWQAYRPSPPTSDAHRIYLLRNGALLSFDRTLGAEPQPVLAGGRLGPLATFAVSPRTPAIAGISKDATRLIRIRPDLPEDRSKQLMATGTAFRSPSWDRFDRLWVVDQRRTGSHVYVFDGDKQREVHVEGLGESEINELAVSSDGTRVAMITHDKNAPPQLQLGLVKSGQSELGSPDPRHGVQPAQIVDLSLLSPLLDEAIDVAWVDPQRLVVLIKDAEAGLVQPFEVGVDGRMPELLGSVASDLVSVAAGGPDVPILFGTSDEKKIWELSTSTGPTPIRVWKPLSDVDNNQIAGTSPAYPG